MLCVCTLRRITTLFRLVNCLKVLQYSYKEPELRVLIINRALFALLFFRD
jgi:hypothetical protein